MNMNKRNKRGSRNETEKEKSLDFDPSTEKVSFPEETEIQREIEITVHSIENLSSLQPRDEENAEVIIIRVEHNDVAIGESSPLNSAEEITKMIDIDHTVIFRIVINNQSSRETLVSTPVLITAVGKYKDDEIIPQVDASGDFENKNKGKKSSALKLKSGKGDRNPIILGICNFDLMPLLLGEKIMTEKLILEIPPYDINESTVIPWDNLPRLNVSAKSLDPNIFPPDMNVNFLSITLESIYNLPSPFTDNINYKANTVVYSENEVPNDIIFNDGIKTNVPDVEKVKCWQTLSHLKVQSAKLSKYKLNTDITKNVLKNEIDLKLSEAEARVQWNSMRRSLISHSGCEVMSNMIKKYKYWPFFFTGNTGIIPQDVVGKQKSNSSSSLLFQCYADVSELLYPGKTRTRTVAQLHAFNIPAMAERTGLNRSIFVKDISKELIKENESKKKKPSTKGSSVPTTAGTAIAESEYAPSIPLLSEKGQPVFVIIEFELHRPLQPARTLEDLSDCIEKMVSKCVLPPDPYTSDLAEEQYSNCVKKLIDTLCEAYQDFLQSRSMPDHTSGKQRPHKVSSPVEVLKTVKNDTDNQSTFCDRTMTDVTAANDPKDCIYPYIKDEISCFIQYLHETGCYLEVRSTLKNKIIMLLDHKFKIETHNLEKKECQNFVATTYIYLVEQMHRTLNKIVEGQHKARDLSDTIPFSSASFYAEESFALGYIDDAREEHLNMIANDKKNPDTWIEYGIFLLRIKDSDKATACCREAIALDKRNKIALVQIFVNNRAYSSIERTFDVGFESLCRRYEKLSAPVYFYNRLLLYGLILSDKEEYRDAEKFFESVTRFYPRFAEGWAILHLFYLRTENFTGADVAIQIAEKCIKDKDPDSITMHSFNREPLMWTALNYPKDRIYLATTILLIKLSSLNFAGIALAQEFSQFGRTRDFLYYMSVQHYIDNRCEDAISHLNEIISTNGMEYSVASLMGHCHLAVGNFDEAIHCYEFANSSFHRPEDLHLVQLRLGYLYLNTDRYEAAKKLFLIVSKNSATCRSWLGVGIACYRLNDMENAEKSLTEANNLDMHNAEVWGYLCLVNMSLQRYDEFLQCYRQVVKNNLTDVEIWTMIQELMESLGYMTPVLSIDSEENSMNESAEYDQSEERDEL